MNRADGLVVSRRGRELDAVGGARTLSPMDRRRSMSPSAACRSPTARRQVAATLGAFERVGTRAIISAGWGGLAHEDLPSTVFAIEEAPHDWLFPRMAAIVHHGGAGTTGATLRAGKPSVVTPFIVDQFAWARLLAGHGLAPAPLPHRMLTTDALAAALTQALSDIDMRAKAAKMGERVRAEDGLSRAVEVIEGVGAVVATRRSGRLRTGTR